MDVILNTSILTGIKDNYGITRFLGVPYALPPIGEHRFCKPRALPKQYDYTKVYSTFPPICPQPRYFLDEMPISVPPPGSIMDEDCLYLNIFVPEGPKLTKWPVLVWIHGGWFQVGNANDVNPSALIATTGAGLQSIVVTIGYRLNIFGFLASSKIAGNFGLWDQRLALEWIHENIGAFGGDAKNVTLAGLSAGANSVHQQLNYEFFESRMTPIIHRAVMFSNSISAQSKLPAEADDQFEEVCRAFAVHGDVSQRMERLRKIPADVLVERLMGLKYHTFRHVTDNDFVSTQLIKRAQDGSFAREFKRRHFKLIIGEVENEASTYRAVNPPRTSLELSTQLQNYYSPSISASLASLRRSDVSGEALKDVFGDLVSAAQVYASERVFLQQLFEAGLTAKDVMRYRISQRLSFYDMIVPKDMGIAHGFCQPIWWFQEDRYTSSEKTLVRNWLAPYIAFIQGRDCIWGTENLKQYRRMNDGQISIESDKYWDYYQPFADVLMPRSRL